MRACFLGQHVCALGFGVATLQLPPVPQPAETEKRADIVTISAPKKRATADVARAAKKQKLAS